MEVPGRKLDPVQELPSSEEFQHGCQQCSEGSSLVPAKKYCEQCQEFLCINCCEFHKKVKTARNHVLLDISLVKTTMLKTTRPTITCSVHTDKTIEFFCPSHDAIICSVCGLLNHKQCPVQYIPDISENYEKSENYQELQRYLDALFDETTSFINTADTNIETTEKDAEIATEKIRKLRKDIDQNLKQKEEELTNTVERMSREDLKRLRDAKEECNRFKTDVVKAQEKLKLFHKNNSDLLIASKQIYPNLQYLQRNFISGKERNQPFSYKFTKSKLCQDFLSLKSFGRVDRVKKEVSSVKPVKHLVHQTTTTTTLSERCISIHRAKVSRLPGIIVETAQDDRDCMITRILFQQPDSLLLTDRYNNCVKRVRISSKTITSNLLLSSEPWDITALSSKTSVVTLPVECKLQVISCSSGFLSPIRTINVNGECRGIDSTEDKIFVSFVEPGKVEILDYSGAVFKTIFNDKAGQPLFTCPYYLRVVRENSQAVIYVSNNKTNTITKLLTTGQVLFTYKDNDLAYPCGLDVTTDGHILVCGYLSRNVQVLSPDGKKIRTLLTEKDGIEDPESVCYNEQNSLVYVTCFDRLSKEMRVYKLQ